MKVFEGRRFSQIKGVSAQYPLLRKKSRVDPLKQCESVGKMGAVAEDDSPIRGLRPSGGAGVPARDSASERTFPQYEKMSLREVIG